jgi:hypothetical protein
MLLPALVRVLRQFSDLKSEQVKFIIFFLSVLIMTGIRAQVPDPEMLPYEQIPEYPDDYTSGNIIARLIDGLGYRYYWATQGLTDSDLEYRPTEEARSTMETLVHIHGLSTVIVNAPQHLPNKRSSVQEELSFSDLRRQTLQNLKKASDLCLGKNNEEISNMPLIFQRGENQSESPFWHMINGPVADALHHTGQVVSFRRSSGNPINPKVNVFMGKTAK